MPHVHRLFLYGQAALETRAAPLRNNYQSVELAAPYMPPSKLKERQFKKRLDDIQR